MQRVWTACACAAVGVLMAAPAGAIVGKRGEPTDLERKRFAVPELSLSSRNERLEDVLDRLPNRAAWQRSIQARGPEAKARTVFVDARSGAATNILEARPLFPAGKGPESMDASQVASAVLAHVRASRDLLGIDDRQLGPALATRITPTLWQLHIPQQHRGVPVRHSRVSATVRHGSLVSMGAQTWGHVALDPTPSVTAEDALAAGFRFVEGREAQDEVIGPRLEIVPIAPPEHQAGKRYVGPIGQGYRHRLVWTFVFRRAPDVAAWEVMVDAHSGEVVAFTDTTHYATRKRSISGGTYPHTNTETCPDVSICGTMRDRTPMPFASYDGTFPNVKYANSAGVYDYEGGTTGTRLLGQRVAIDTQRTLCHAPYPLGTTPLQSSSGVLALGGSNGQHDCDLPTQFPWNTAAVRTTYYEANKISEMAAGWLPDNPFIIGDQTVGGRLGAEVNTVLHDGHGNPIFCNAYYVSSFTDSIGFLVSGDGCRNTGEIADVVHHEWGHFLDDHDAHPGIGPFGEGYADIGALYRTQQSCQGPGFFITNDEGCGLTPDGTGANTNEAAPHGSYCTTSCSGVRDADFAKHVPGVPADALGFVCGQCADAPDDEPGPCGKQRHCGSTPVSQAAWDLVARDLVAPPHNLDGQTAFIVGNKLFYQGSQNVGAWFSCECGVKADGCQQDSGYMQWLHADDDNDTLHDGTPHMTAIFNAFDRHGMACPAPLPRNGGCAGKPTTVTNVTATPGAYFVRLDWTPVAGATRYWVFRTEGHAGCNYGKALIAEVTGLTHTDREVAAHRPYYYNVVAVGQDDACFGPASPCVSVTPGTGSFAITCTPGTLSLPAGPTSATCAVTAQGGFSGEVELGCAGLPTGSACQFTPATVTLGVNGSATAGLQLQPGLQTPLGSQAFQVRGTPPVQPGTVPAAAMTLVVNGSASDLTAQFDPGLRVPACRATGGRSCDTGPSLVRFRDNRGPEPNQPNVLGATCPDGSATILGGNGSSDRIVVATADGSPLAAGRTVTVTATVQARAAFSQDLAEFFFAADAAQPVWVPIGTAVPTTAGTQALSVRYTLPTGPLQAVRVAFRKAGTTACSAASPNDTDDLVFAVGN